MGRRVLLASLLGLVLLACLAQIGAGASPVLQTVLQTGAQGPRRTTLTPGTAALLNDLGGPGVLSGGYYSSTTGGSGHVGYEKDWRSYHFHGEALDLRPDAALWQTLYAAMTRADLDIVELYGPWGLYKNGRALDPSANRRLWFGHQDHIHVSFTGTPEQASAIVASSGGVDPLPRPQPEPQQRPEPRPARAARRPIAPATEQARRRPHRELAAVPLVSFPATVTAARRGAGFVYGGAGTAGLAILVFLLVFGAGLAATTPKRGRWLRGRLAAHVVPPPVDAPAPRRRRRPLPSSLLAATERFLGRFDVYRRTAWLLERADLELRTVEFFYLAAGAGLLGGVVCALVGGPLAGFAGAIVGGLVPWLFARRRAERRRLAFEAQLPDVLVTLAASLKAGHSFKQGLQAIAEEGQPPFNRELTRVLAESRLGRPLDEALAAMTARVGSKDLDFLLSAVAIQTQVGGSMAGLVELVGETVRERQQFARKLRGLTAQGRASAKVLTGLPIVLAGGLTAINPGYMSPLFHTRTGHLLLAASVVMTTIGSLVLRRMVVLKG